MAGAPSPELLTMTKIEIPFAKTTLDNGLRVVTHHDPAAPIVAVSVWYHVGSKNDVPGKTGFAHLFEHLMFEGSAHHRDEYFRPLELAGASVINGTTNRDRTNYFETVPANSLDLALWLESDRMGHLLEAISQETLDEQREVVRNEKKQSDDQPYGRVFELLAKTIYPGGHPYSWPIIGRIEDLDAAELTDVQDWFETWYRPNNAVIVISGDIDPDEALARVEHYFAPLSPGPPVERPGLWMAAGEESRRVQLEDRVAQARTYRAWNVPSFHGTDYHHLGLLAKVLSRGKSSRLYQRLVYEDQIATDVSASVWGGEIGGTFIVQASCSPTADPAAVEAALDEEMASLLERGVRQEELDRARARTMAAFVRGLERTGGFGGKTEALAHGEVFHGRPDAYLDSVAAVETATTEDLGRVAHGWLENGDLTLEVVPFEEGNSRPSTVDRSSLPPDVGPVISKFPQFERQTLSNDLDVFFLHRDKLPLAHFSLLTDAGFAADRLSPRGTATLTMAAIDEGTNGRTALEISDALAALGTWLGAGTALDSCHLRLSGLSSSWADGLAMLAEIVREPSFPEEEIERLKREQVARIGREMVTPVPLALRLLPVLLYGEGHPYAMPFTGSGSVAEVEATGREHLVGFHDQWIRPQRSALLCLGDLDRDETLVKLERLFGDWEPASDPARDDKPAIAADGARVFLVDRPGAIQSVVIGGQVVPPRNDPSELDLEAFHLALGGTFTSRLNMNLREDKGWTYGASSLLWGARAERPFLLYSSVQTDATAKALLEMDRELRDLLAEQPITEQELDKAQRQLTRSLPGRWETLADIAGELEDLLSFELPLRYYDDYAQRVAALSPDEITATAASRIFPERFVWVIVGDLAEVRSEIEDLGIGSVVEIDDAGHAIP